MDIFKALQADPNVSPALKRFLPGADSGAKPLDGDQVLALRRAAYASALGRFDFGFEFTDDHALWKRCNTELCRLREERAAIDPQGVIWDKFAGPGYLYSKVLA